MAEKKIAEKGESIGRKPKRGRKASKERKGYFYEAEEEAVVEYISTEDEDEKNRIYNSILKPAFTKMVESIINRYRLYPPDEEFQETFDDTLSFLMTKLSCFDPSTNYRAYSYCGTICKNYLIYKINKFKKNRERNISYDDPMLVPQDVTPSRYTEARDSSQDLVNELTVEIVKSIKSILDKGSDGVKPLKENEKKVGLALIELFSNWEDLFVQMGSDKFNKSSILMFLKETTMLSTTEIRNAMKVYKNSYYLLKKRLIES